MQTSDIYKLTFYSKKDNIAYVYGRNRVDLKLSALKLSIKIFLIKTHAPEPFTHPHNSAKKLQLN